jgi:nitroreductase/NAD-dependent dihydropyrimidine dehydrogenase PreA subunit
MISIDKELCVACNECVGHCPAGIIGEGPEIKPEIHGHCAGCGHCAVACPSNAIRVSGLGDLDIAAYRKDIPVSHEDLNALLKRRRSIRKYKPGSVSRTHLEQIIGAASMVPTAHNWQAFRAYVCTDREVIGRIRMKLTEHYTRLIEVFKKPVAGMPDAIREEIVFAFDRLVVNPLEGRDSLFWHAGALLVFTTMIPHPLCVGDAWMASFAAVMCAETIPVGTCYNGFLIMGLNEDPSIKPLMNIPKEEVVVTGLTLGYPDEIHYRYPPRRTMPITWI